MRCKDAVKIPVSAMAIFAPEDLSHGGRAAAMGDDRRTAASNPWIFRQIRQHAETAL